MGEFQTVPLTDWWVFRRVHEVESAFRVNVARSVALVLFYGVYWTSLRGDATATFHRSVQLTALACLLLVIGVFVALQQRFLPPLAKYLTTLADLVFVTVLALAGAKANSSIALIPVWYARTSRSVNCWSTVCARSAS